MRYFELGDDLFFENRWHLSRLYDDHGTELDSREFRYGNYIDPGPPLKCYMWNEDTIVHVQPPLRLRWSREGMPLDFTYTDSEMPVVNNSVSKILSKFADKDIQRFSVRIDKMNEDYEIINVISLIDCIDTEKSAIELWEEGNSVRPDLTGEPYSISNLTIDPSRVGDHHVFRLKGWDNALIVSETVKNHFEEANVTGILYRQV